MPGDGADELSRQLGQLSFHTPTATAQDSGPTRFQPRTPSQEKAIVFDVPRFLFRVYSPKSDGFTDSTWIKSRRVIYEEKSADAERLSHKDLLSLADDEATAEGLDQKLRWRTGIQEDSPACNLMSWTCSLLFALKYIYHRHYNWGDGSPLREIKLMILDTATLPKDVFVRDLYLIKHYHGLSSSLEGYWNLRQSQYYFGEYLSQGQLLVEGCCSVVSAQDLDEGDLRSLIPPHDIANNDREWAKWVVRHRNSSHFQTPPRLKDEDITTVVNIARLFAENFRIPVAAALLGLGDRTPLGRKILDGVLTRSSHFTKAECMRDYADASSSTKLKGYIKDAEEHLVEVHQFNSILHALSDHLHRACRVNELKSKVDKLLLDAARLKFFLRVEFGGKNADAPVDELHDFVVSFEKELAWHHHDVKSACRSCEHEH